MDMKVKVGLGLRSRKGAYDYKVVSVSGTSCKVAWIGPEKPGYSYTRIVKLDGIEKAYIPFEIAVDYTPKGEWRGRETYVEHRKAMSEAKK